jgi:hypothetical protein
MARPKGSKNRRTMLREAEEAMGRPEEFVDSLQVLEHTMRHFYGRALLLKQINGKPEQIDADLKEAAAIAEKIAPYRHPRLSAMKLAGDPNNPVRIKEDASLDELRAEVQKHFKILAPVLDLEALMAPADGVTNRDVPRAGADNGTGADRSR